jgi:GNAT superfamily N-acetyltransferase
MDARYTVSPAAESDLADVFALIDERIRWMDEQGIVQWNTYDYWTVFPRSHYRAAMEAGRLFVLKEDGRTVASVTLTVEDAHWHDGAAALYIHHLVSATDSHGAGDAMLAFCTEKALTEGCDYLRLDCARHNRQLNDYYETHGFVLVGDDPGPAYMANLREKKLRD